MAWTSPKTYVAGAVHTAAELNTYERDNFIAVRAGGIAIAGQAAEDVILGSDATQLKRLAKGNPLEVLRVNEAGTALEFGTGAVKHFKDPRIVGRSRFVSGGW